MELPLVGVHTHTRPQGSLWSEKPEKKLEKNLEPPIINLIIRERQKKFSNFCRKIQSQMCPRLPLVGVHVPQGTAGVAPFQRGLQLHLPEALHCSEERKISKEFGLLSNLFLFHSFFQFKATVCSFSRRSCAAKKNTREPAINRQIAQKLVTY